MRGTQKNTGKKRAMNDRYADHNWTNPVAEGYFRQRLVKCLQSSSILSYSIQKEGHVSIG